MEARCNEVIIISNQVLNVLNPDNIGSLRIICDGIVCNMCKLRYNSCIFDASMVNGKKFRLADKVISEVLKR